VFNVICQIGECSFLFNLVFVLIARQIEVAFQISREAYKSTGFNIDIVIIVGDSRIHRILHAQKPTRTDCWGFK
jgi:hypothetical protein